MSRSAALIYQYDGSFDGFLCCVFRAFYKKEDPDAILSEEEAQETLFPPTVILTDPGQAARVYRSIPSKIGAEALHCVQLAFLSRLKDKELRLLAFLRLGYQYGSPIMKRLTDDTVFPILRAARDVSCEAHQYKGFTRFSEYQGTLLAEIEPNNDVLPLLARHFSARMPNESYAIFDRTRKRILLASGGHFQIYPLNSFDMPDPDTQEKLCRMLWTRFYDTVSIEARFNPKCRMSHMPKRYWQHMTEMQEENRPKRLRDC